ncbi:MAG: toll/interleukin-1 receptor domain-containing protein [Chthoniobacteraceae bacterium]
MAAHFPWDALLELIAADQRAVPIVGTELSTLPALDGANFDLIAARHLAAGHALPGEVKSLSQVVADLCRGGRNPAQITRELSALHRELLAGIDATTLPESLRLLADIRDFPLIVTTAPDALLATAIRIARERDAGPLVASLGGDTDLPRNWMQGPRPTLFHLFGRINAVPDFALTEEDVLEFLHRMQSEAHRPGQLLDELRARHLLLVGLRLPDWALRLLLRTLHGARLSEDTGQVIVLASDSLTRDGSLVDFLRGTGRRVWIYEEGGSADFIRELQKRWHAAQDEGWSTTADGQAVPAEPTEMAPGAVYLSAARADRASAERFAALLDEAGLDVWFDRNETPSGPRYERRIHQHLQQCDLFVPLLSSASDAQPDAFFRKEWQWAIERERAAPGSRVVVPVWVGESAAAPAAPAPFETFPLRAAPGGQPSPELLRECIDAVRAARAQRNA